MRVLDEMNRLCGGDEEDVAAETGSLLLTSSPRPNPSSGESTQDGFEAFEAAASSNMTGAGKSLIGDQLLSSTSSGLGSAKIIKPTSSSMMSSSNLNNNNGGGGNNSSSLSRSRHCSANSAKSCVSFDSAIGDVYSVQTPTRNGDVSNGANSSSALSDLDRDLFDFSSAASSSSSPTLATTSSCATTLAGLQFDNLAASVCFDIGDATVTSAVGLDLDGADEFGGISLRLVGSEDVDLVGTSFSLAMNSDLMSSSCSEPSPITFSLSKSETTVSTNLPSTTSSSSSTTTSLSKRRHYLNNEDVYDGLEYGNAKRKRPSPPSSSLSPPKQQKPSLLSPQMNIQRQEVELICLELLHRFQHASGLHPKTQAKSWMAKSGEDPLLVTTRLLGDSLTRLRIFVHGLDPMNWLMWHDRNILYNNNVCTLSVFKAAVSVNLEAVPTAYPLPYGEYLGEVEALHLILAHDLYNELRSLLSHIQSLGIREFPVMLLVMMVAFFAPHPNLKQADKVVRVNDYYMHKLQVGNNFCRGLIKKYHAISRHILLKVFQGQGNHKT